MKFQITEIKTIATMIEVEGKSYEEVEKNYEAECIAICLARDEIDKLKTKTQ